ALSVITGSLTSRSRDMLTKAHYIILKRPGIRLQSVLSRKNRWVLTLLLFVPGVLVLLAALPKSGGVTDEGPKENARTSVEASREAKAEDASTRGGGILELPSNSPNVDPMIAEKGAPFYPSRVSTDGLQVTADMFVEPGACSECHVEIYNQWSHSVMSH